MEAPHTGTAFVRRSARAGCQLTRGAGAGDAAAAGPNLQAAAGRPRDKPLGLQPLAQRQRRLICGGGGVCVCVCVSVSLVPLRLDRL